METAEQLFEWLCEQAFEQELERLAHAVAFDLRHEADIIERH